MLHVYQYVTYTYHKSCFTTTHSHCSCVIPYICFLANLKFKLIFITTDQVLYVYCVIGQINQEKWPLTSWTVGSGSLPTELYMVFCSWWRCLPNVSKKFYPSYLNQKQIFRHLLSDIASCTDQATKTMVRLHEILMTTKSYFKCIVLRPISYIPSVNDQLPQHEDHEL